MGNSQSSSSTLSKKDVERLQRRFNRLAGSNGRVNIVEFQNMVEMGGNPFVPAIFKLFDKTGDNALSMEEFTEALTYFGSLTSVEDQYNFAFRVYDQDRDGLISATELASMLSLLMGHAVPQAQLEQVVHNTMAEYDRDGDAHLDPAEFRQLLCSSDLGNMFSLSM